MRALPKNCPPLSTAGYRAYTKYTFAGLVFPHPGLMPIRMVTMLHHHYLPGTPALAIYTQRIRTVTHPTIAGTCHTTAPFVELGAVDSRTAKTLAGIFSTSDGPGVLIAEGHASIIGHVWAVEGGPVWKRALCDGVGVAAGVGPGGVGW